MSNSLHLYLVVRSPEPGMGAETPSILSRETAGINTSGVLPSSFPALHNTKGALTS